jgi:hypothetical protein
LHEEDPTTSL